MIDYRSVFARYSCQPTGVVHVGGYTGGEEPLYRDIGFKSRLFVEAQPDTFAALEKNLEGSGAFCENVAVSDRPGRASFHVASNGQSSSLLPLHKHLDIYREIVETQCIHVETKRLDDILGSAAYADLSFNFLNIDVQGGELNVLAGAPALLKRMDILNLEVNFDELYLGAPHISQLDAFLHAFDFVRADTVLLHATWGDAIYVRNGLTKTKS